MSAASHVEINVPFREAGPLHLVIRVGGCRVRIVPGQAEPWIEGTYRDPSEGLPLRVIDDGNRVTITQDATVTAWTGLLRGSPELSLRLGTAQPYALTLEGGASESVVDLGGLPITRLVAKQGAGKYEIDFSAPNPEEMTLLELGGGALGMDVRNLANANAAEIRVEGGASAYTFDFGGTLRRNTQVKISTGVSSVEIAVPASTAASVTSQTVLGHVDAGDGFTRDQGAYRTQAALAGGGPVLTIDATVALGALRLRTR